MLGKYNLAKVDSLLKGNPNVEIVHGRGFDSSPALEDPNGLNYQVEYLVAPKTGIYEAYNLRLFMLDLFPGMKPGDHSDANYCIDDAFPSTSHRLFFGKATFFDNLGKQTTSTSTRAVFDKNAVAMLKSLNLLGPWNIKNGIACRRDTEEDKINLTTLVRPFPDKKLAQLVAEERFSQVIFREWVDLRFLKAYVVNPERTLAKYSQSNQ